MTAPHEPGPDVSRGPGRLRRTTVAATRWVTPRIVRLTVRGDLEDFPDNGTDQHVALYFYPPEARVPDRLEPEALKELHEFAFPRTRRYTIREFRRLGAEADIDLVVHQPPGPAASRGESARVGDELLWWGPTAAWRPPEATTDLLMIGDETALPAIEASIRELGGALRVTVVAEVADASEEVYLADLADRARIRWVHRGGRHADGDPSAIESAVRALLAEDDVLGGVPAVWVGAEFATAGAMRRLFLGEHGMTKDAAFIVSYWIHGQPQDKRPDQRNRARNLRRRAEDPQRADRSLLPGWESLQEV